MSYSQFLVLLFVLSSCHGNGQQGNVSDEKDQMVIDSCNKAVLFGNATIVEEMVDKNYSGELRNYWDSDTSKVDFVHLFENGRLVSSKFYYENGHLQEEYTFLCGALHGLQRFYNKSGVLVKSIPYRYGRTNGIGKLYDKKGNLSQEVTIVNDSIIHTKNFDTVETK